MSLLLRNWLVTDLKTRLDLDLSIEQQFSSGYRFGKLLEKLGVEEENCKKYVKSDAIDALIKNYCTLEQTLREKLNIRLSSQLAVDLINRQPGAAQKLLYEIKSIFAINSKKFIPKTRPGRPVYDSYPSSPVDGQPQTEIFNTLNNKLELPVLPFENLGTSHFETVLQKNLKRKNVYVKPEPPSHAADSFKKQKKALPPIPKFTPQDRVSDVKQTMEEQVERESKSLPRKPKPYKVTSSTQDLQALEAIIPPKKVEKVVNIKSERLAKEMSKFEDKLTKSSTESEIPQDEIKAYLQQSTDIDSHIKSLQNKIDFSKSIKESQLYLSKLASQKLHLEALRKDREQTRKMILLAQAKSAQAAEEKAIEDVMLLKLLRQSKQERRIAEQLMTVRNEKEIMKQNRVYRDQQYAITREREYKQALEREFKLYAEAKKGFKEKVDMVLEQHFEILKQVRDKEHAENEDWVRNKMVKQIVDLALKVNDYKTLNGKAEVPFKKMREWKTLMANEISVIEHVELPLEKNSIPPVPVETSVPEATVSQNSESAREEVPASVNLLDTVEFDDYIHFTGGWESAQAEGVILSNQKLGVMLEELMNATKPAEKKLAIAPIPSTPLRVVLLGKKFSGKHTLAGFIAETYGMEIIQVEDLIKDAISQADMTFPRKKDKNEKDPKKLTKPQIGARLKYALNDGQSPDDALLVQLVTDAMANEPSPEKRSGWLILDFPQTRSQAMLFEKEISGYEDPKPAKKGDLKRKEKDMPPKTKNRSMIVEASPLDSATQVPASGIDLVLFLDITSEVAIHRGVGQYVDPETGENFHIEANPPALDSPGTMERVFAMENTTAQIQYQIAAFEAQEIVLKDWFQQFKILTVLDANQPPEKIQALVHNLLNEMIDFINLALIAEDKSNAPPTDEEASTVKPRPSTSFWSRSNTVAEAATELSSEAMNPISKAASMTLKSLPTKKFPTKEFADILVDQWVALETSYTESLKFCFRAIRRLRDDASVYLYETKSQFQSFLLRPDVEQDLVDTFQKEYNAIEEDFRADPDVKAELHLRVEELLDKLWNIADRRRDEAEIERISIIEDRWIEDQSYVLANLTITMIQAEADRFLQTRQFIIDYFREINGLALPEVSKPKLRIPFVALNEAPPIDVGTAMIAISEQAAQKRKDEHSKPEKSETTEGGKKPKSEKSKEKKGDKSKYSSSDKQAMHSIAESAKLDPDSVNFPDITSNIDLVLNLISGEYSAAFLGQTVETKKTATAGDRFLLMIEEPDKSFPLEFLAIIAIEEQMLKQRIERLKQRSIEIFKELRSKTVDTFHLLDESIGATYKSEVDAAKNLSIMIKESIESEQKLSNRILLQNEKVIVDYSTLVVPVEAEQRPQTPQEELSNLEHFKVSQLQRIGKDLFQMSPTGVISIKLMADYLVKLMVFANGQDPLPEGYMGLDAMKFQQILAVLDQNETGYINWKKFWLILSRVLPITLSELLELKQAFGTKSITKPAFMKIPLWFEKRGQSSDEGKPLTPDKNCYDRNKKLKSALFDIFCTPTRNSGKTFLSGLKADSGEGESQTLQTQEFLLLLCLDQQPFLALQKAFHVFQESNLGCTRDQAYKPFSALYYYPKSSHRLDIDQVNAIYPPSIVSKVYEGTDKMPWEKFVELLKYYGSADWLECKLYDIPDLSPK